MLHKNNRLKSRFEFHITRKYGIHEYDPYFHLFVLKPTNYSDDTKIGIVTSNKLDKSAVKRNRIKRLVRSAIRNIITKIPGGYWICINPTPKSLTLKYEEINNKLNQLIQKVPFTD